METESDTCGVGARVVDRGTGEWGGWVHRAAKAVVDEKAQFNMDIFAELVEPMGSDTLVWTTVAGRHFRFRMDGQAAVKTGDKMRIGFDPSRGSLFDVASEERM